MSTANVLLERDTVNTRDKEAATSHIPMKSNAVSDADGAWKEDGKSRKGNGEEEGV